VRRTLLRLRIPLKRPFVSAGGVIADRELLLLRIHEGDVVGCGEAAPLQGYDGVPMEQVVAALTSRRGLRPPQARCAEELARLDAEARRDGRPLTEPGAEAIPVNWTIAAGPPEEAAARAEEGLREGYSTFKLKVGLPDDQARVAAVRRVVGPWPALRLDANAAWDVDEAVAAIRTIEEHDLEFVEQPCRTLEELAQVRERVSVPIAADEPVTTADDVNAAAEAGACDVVNVKLATSGGFQAAREALRAASEKGLGAFLSSSLDGPWTIAAALQLAASERLRLACGLATLDFFDARIARALPGPSGGVMPVPQGPGLGVDVDDAALEEVLVEELA
jgi:o-succinylbenzoate synthase